MFSAETPEIAKNRVKPNILWYRTVWDVGFRYTYLPEEFVEAGKAVYSETARVVFPLNPTYVDIRILFFNPRLIIKLTLK